MSCQGGGRGDRNAPRSGIEPTSLAFRTSVHKPPCGCMPERCTLLNHDQNTHISQQAVRTCMRTLLNVLVMARQHLQPHQHAVKPLKPTTTPLYRSLYLGPKQSVIVMIPIPMLQLSKPITSLKGSFKVSAMVSQFREVLLQHCFVVVRVYTASTGLICDM